VGESVRRDAGLNWIILAAGAVFVLPVAGCTASHVHSPSVSASTSAVVPSQSQTSHRPARTSSVPPPIDRTGGVIVTAAGAVLPDHARTPGATNPDVTQDDIATTICVSGWTSSIRPPSSYTTTLKERQLASGYAYHGDMNPGDYEEDHLISLELGGSPRAELNLWPEPYLATDGARVKDRIENKLHTLVCAHELTLAAAQHAIATNWFAAYRTYIGNPAPAPTTSTASATRTTQPPPASSLACSAAMSDAHPAQYSTTTVIVHTGVAGAAVMATAHYKTKDTTNYGTAAGNGVASIDFRISRATVGYTVIVDVTVNASGTSKSCSTSFTPL
jgi:hypothetical protein